MLTDMKKADCSGCSACINICPKNCITMKHDKYGFLYPHVDQKICVECGACDHICEEIARRDNLNDACYAYGAIAKDKYLQLSSSSGGIFTLLCNDILSRNGIIFGVAMASCGKKAFHKEISRKEDISQLRGAKYLQSDVGDSFLRIKKLLHDGKEVLFSGTPCQVDGLKAYIGNYDKKLLYVDTFCHGVPSPMIWKKYCVEIEAKNNGIISSVNFRHKKYSWEKPYPENHDKCKVLFRSKNDDPYMRLYLNDYILRPSCYDCHHKGLQRKSDITLADFWGVDVIAPGLSNGAGVSLAIIHTKKGLWHFEQIMEHIQMMKVDPIESIKYNGAAVKSAQKPEGLDDFWQQQPYNSIESLANKFVPVNNTIKTYLKRSNLYGLFKKNKKVNMENGICIVLDSARPDRSIV